MMRESEKENRKNWDIELGDDDNETLLNLETWNEKESKAKARSLLNKTIIIAL
jgi:hypothetical protein